MLHYSHHPVGVMLQ